MAAEAANYLYEKLHRNHEVLNANAIGRQLFDLENCLICKDFCIKLDAFALHIEQKHKAGYEETEQMPVDAVFKPEIKEDEELSLTNDERQLDCEDPLLQQPQTQTKELSKNQQDNDLNEDNNVDIKSDDDDLNANDDDNYATDTTDEMHLEYGNDISPHNKKLFLVFLQHWQQSPLLWQHGEQQEQLLALQQLTTAINQQMCLDLTAGQVATAMSVARYKFRHELRKQCKAKAAGRQLTRLDWHTEALRFLEAGIKWCKRKRRGERILQERNALPLQGLTHDENLQFIKIYESYPCLWNMQHIGFRFKHKRQEALLQMQQTIENDMHIKMSSTVLQKRLYRIRYACTQQKYKQLQCAKQQQFQSDCVYYEHISFLNDSVGPFKCSHCAQMFYGVDQYKMHMSKHDGTMPFSCPTCNRGFMKVGNCMVHMRRHTRDFTFECNLCDKYFATSTELSVHTRSHTGEKPYCCEICGQNFRTWTFLDTHVRRHQKRAKYKCEQCNKEFYESNKWQDHKNAHDNVRDKICGVCGKGFTGRKYLRQHMLLHNAEKKFSCKICQKQFAQHAGLSAHMKSHGTSLSGLNNADLLK